VPIVRKPKVRMVLCCVLGPGGRGTSAFVREEPADGLACDLGWDHVSALELPVLYLVAGALELGNDPAAAAVNR
jgi:hypothetical protein